MRAQAACNRSRELIKDSPQVYAARAATKNLRVNFWENEARPKMAGTFHPVAQISRAALKARFRRLHYIRSRVCTGYAAIEERKESRACKRSSFCWDANPLASPWNVLPRQAKRGKKARGNRATLTFQLGEIACCFNCSIYFFLS